MKERHLKILIIFVVLSGILTQYQNCGGSPAQNDLYTDEKLGNDPKVGIINPVQTGKIQFIQSKAEVKADDETFTAYGVCSEEQQNALLSWRIVDETETLVASGKSICDRGAFEVVMEDVESVPCDGEVLVRAFLGSKEKTEIIVYKNCGG